MAEDLKGAMINRSLRAIKTELEFLTDANLITPQQMSSIIAQLPAQTELRAPLAATPSPVPLPQPTPPAFPLRGSSNTNYSEKQNYFPGATSPAPPSPNAQAGILPPAYPAVPEPSQPILSYAVALYAFAPTDAGDLALVPQERIAVTEFTNAEWWKGRSEKTGLEGIFPRSYVRVEGKYIPGSEHNNSYGNMPLDVSQSGSGQPQGLTGGKGAEMGKKFGRKLGNAAIFGAGATMGADLVNSIL